MPDMKNGSIRRLDLNLSPIIEAMGKLRALIDKTMTRDDDAIRSVVGTIEIAESDPDLTRADEYIRSAFSRSLKRPTAQRKIKRVAKPRVKKDR